MDTADKKSVDEAAKDDAAENGNIDAIDSASNVSTIEEEEASHDTGIAGDGDAVVLNANGMKLEGTLYGAPNADGTAKVLVDGTVYDATGYGWNKSQYHRPGEVTPDEYKANANAR